MGILYVNSIHGEAKQFASVWYCIPVVYKPVSHRAYTVVIVERYCIPVVYRQVLSHHAHTVVIVEWYVSW